MHGNERYGYFEDSDFRPKIEKCTQFSEMVRFWTVASKIPASVCIYIYIYIYTDLSLRAGCWEHSLLDQPTEGGIFDATDSILIYK